jgi:hypothetical protein
MQNRLQTGQGAPNLGVASMEVFDLVPAQWIDWTAAQFPFWEGNCPVTLAVVFGHSLY